MADFVLVGGVVFVFLLTVYLSEGIAKRTPPWLREIAGIPVVGAGISFAGIGVSPVVCALGIIVIFGGSLLNLLLARRLLS